MSEPTTALAPVDDETPTKPRPADLFRTPAIRAAYEIAYTFVQSGYFRDARSASQAMTKILAGQELGFGPMASMQGVYIVEGKGTPSLSANLIAAAVKRTGKYNYRIREHTNDCCRIEFFEAGESVGCSEFSMADAAAAGLANKGVWKAYPRNMLFARAISNGARWYCAEVFGGNVVYTPEELGLEEAVDDSGASVLAEPSAEAAP